MHHQELHGASLVLDAKQGIKFDIGMFPYLLFGPQASAEGSALNFAHLFAPAASALCKIALLVARPHLRLVIAGCDNGRSTATLGRLAPAGPNVTGTDAVGPTAWVTLAVAS